MYKTTSILFSNTKYNIFAIKKDLKMLEVMDLKVICVFQQYNYLGVTIDEFT
jgi:hypothetical protein